MMGGPGVKHKERNARASTVDWATRVELGRDATDSLQRQDTEAFVGTVTRLQDRLDM